MRRNRRGRQSSRNGAIRHRRARRRRIVSHRCRSHTRCSSRLQRRSRSRHALGHKSSENTTTGSWRARAPEGGWRPWPGSCGPDCRPPSRKCGFCLGWLTVSVTPRGPAPAGVVRPALLIFAYWYCTGTGRGARSVPLLPRQDVAGWKLRQAAMLPSWRTKHSALYTKRPSYGSKLQVGEAFIIEAGCDVCTASQFGFLLNFGSCRVLVGVVHSNTRMIHTIFIHTSHS